jgi:hypothetical protein
MRTRSLGRAHARHVVLLVGLLLALGTLAGPAVRAQAPVQGPGATTVNVEIILDSSGSMAEEIGNETRMGIAKRVLNRVLAAIPVREGINVGFRIYGHLGDNTTAGKPVSCRSSQLVVPIDGVDKAAISRQIRAARPTGWTPLAYSLGLAGRDFAPATEGVVNAVVLVTDGLETCGGDPCAVSAALNASEIALTTHVVGFALSDEERRTLQCIADNSGGLLLGARDADELSDALFTILEDLEVVSTTGTLVIESIAGLWPAATATCAGSANDSDPQGGQTIVVFDTTNRADVPTGTCEVTWIEATGDESSVSVLIEADRVTTIRGSVIAFPQGAGEAYRVTGASGVRIWEAPFEWGDRAWVLPGQYRVELVARVGDPILVGGEIGTTAGTIVSVHVGTEP